MGACSAAGLWAHAQLPSSLRFWASAPPSQTLAPRPVRLLVRAQLQARAFARPHKPKLFGREGLLVHAQLRAGAFAPRRPALLTGLIETSSIFQLHFCGLQVINHFFCDLPSLLVLSCSSQFLSQVVNLIVVCAIGGTSALVLVSYDYITTALMKIHSIQGWKMAFNTCAFHLNTVIPFYGSGLFSYLHSSAGYSWDQDKMLSLFYTDVIPMLNSFIYSLLNKEIKGALKKLKERKKLMSFIDEKLRAVTQVANDSQLLDGGTPLQTSKLSV
ncbi:LOW QUALITY PROTEIN: olfactory receptor 5A1-like [Rhynchonycteris naso]